MGSWVFMCDLNSIFAQDRKKELQGNFKIANIKIKKDELFDNFISEFNF